MNPHKKNYWNNRYEGEKYIRGLTPSESCVKAEQFFHSCKAETMLVGGCGYGRHTEYLLKKGYQVYGFDISDKAIELAKSRNENFCNGRIKYFTGDLENIIIDNKFDGFFFFNLIHLFLTETQRNSIYNKINNWLISQAAVFLSVMSTEEYSFRHGKKLGENTYESKPGRAVHYFTPESLEKELGSFYDVKEITEIIEPENHGGKKHVHHLLGAYCLVKKVE